VTRSRRWLIGCAALGLAGILLAQRFPGRSGFWSEGGARADVRTAREIPSHSTGTPLWENPRGFETDVFTFTRVRYGSGRSGYGRRGGGWATDLPDSDLNLSYRLQQMTSLKCSPDGRILELTDPDLASHPWIYIVEPGALRFTDEEVLALRKFLLNGGFLMFDDFWGESAWQNVEREMRRVFPERAFAELRVPDQSQGPSPQRPHRRGKSVHGDHLGTARRRLTHGPPPGDPRRQGPDDGLRGPQQRQRRRLGARGGVRVLF
jgi:hypothetical protein